MALNGLTKGPLWEWWNSVMFSKNPPEHTRLRTLVSRAFTPRSVKRLRRPYRCPGRPRPSPAARGDLRPARRSRSRPADLRLLDQAARPGVQRDTRSAHSPGDRGRARFARRVRAVAHRRPAPALTENLMFAGHDTTRGALAAMSVLFARSPDQLAAVAADPGLIPRTAEEVLRYEPITFGTARLASEEMNVGGQDATGWTPGTSTGSSPSQRTCPTDAAARTSATSHPANDVVPTGRPPSPTPASKQAL